MNKRPAKCPKCGNKTLVLTETSMCYQEFIQTDGIIDPIGENSQGGIIYTDAKCNCGHKWRLRGIIQVIELEGYPQE